MSPRQINWSILIGHDIGPLSEHEKAQAFADVVSHCLTAENVQSFLGDLDDEARQFGITTGSALAESIYLITHHRDPLAAQFDALDGLEDSIFTARGFDREQAARILESTHPTEAAELRKNAGRLTILVVAFERVSALHLGASTPPVATPPTLN